MAGSRNGMRVVVALCLTSFGPLSLGLSCAGIFYPSLSASTGVSAGLLSYYTSALWLAALATLPLLGRLFTRLGARACVTAACALIALDFVALSFTNGFIWFMACGLVMGVGVAMLLFLAPSTLVNRWFTKRAGFLLGLVMAFTGVGGAVWCAVGGACIEAWGWHGAYRLFCGLSLVLGVIPALLCVADAPAPAVGEALPAEEDVHGAASVPATETNASVAENEGRIAAEKPGSGRSPHLDAHRHPYLPYQKSDGTSIPAAPVSQLPPDVAARVAKLKERIPAPAAPEPKPAQEAKSTKRLLPTEVGVPAKRALPSGLLLLIADIAFILNFGMYVYFIIPSFAATLPAAVAFPLLGAIASSLAMVGQTVSKIVLGFVGDRAPAAAAAAGILSGLAGIAVLWFFPGQTPLILAGAFLFGAYYGVTNVMMPIFTRLGFGLRDYPRIYARVSMAASLGSIVSGLLWGTVIGATGGYAELFAGVSIFLAVALWLVLVLARRLKREGAL